ncbi:hypothetical protein HYPSUDRAFT_362755 [Hypholoma sublateritium FD-334 SS-4]|uniref:Uncharacterized protein n=1 Tax=Hypholoma sublateritium (strain FD-334 SS-4) TaxID=945553 RepID=A0A0D2P583_HYPSF|nr:hypothetical protein HYPSUDRAFT_362755 [Hypholoma sublateritium FD-334 SS-4]
MSPIPQLMSTPVSDDTDVNIPEIFTHFWQFVVMAYDKIVIAHPYIFGFVLIMWSYHPSAPFQAIAYIIWMLPKKMFIGLLRCVGFGEGVQPGNTSSQSLCILPGLNFYSQIPDSYASRYQARHYCKKVYGGNGPRFLQKILPNCH